MKKWTRSLASLAILSTLALSACGNDNQSQGPQDPPPPHEDENPPEETSAPELAISGDTISEGKAYCHVGSTFSWDLTIKTPEDTFKEYTATMTVDGVTSPIETLVLFNDDDQLLHDSNSIKCSDEMYGAEVLLSFVAVNQEGKSTQLDLPLSAIKPAEFTSGPKLVDYVDSDNSPTFFAFTNNQAYTLGQVVKEEHFTEVDFAVDFADGKLTIHAPANYPTDNLADWPADKRNNTILVKTDLTTENFQEQDEKEILTSLELAAKQGGHQVEDVQAGDFIAFQSEGGQYFGAIQILEADVQNNVLSFSFFVTK